MPGTVTVSREIGAPAPTVMALITDVTRVGEWSPETRSCRWVAGFTGPAVGAKFRGSNRHGPHRWTTTCQVTAADPDRFAFHVSYLAQPVADWDYTVTSTPAGCTVTETWVDRRSRWFTATFGNIGTGVRDRIAHNRAGMAATLAALAAEAEASRSG